MKRRSALLVVVLVSIHLSLLRELFPQIQLFVGDAKRQVVTPYTPLCEALKEHLARRIKELNLDSGPEPLG